MNALRYLIYVDFIDIIKVMKMKYSYIFRGNDGSADVRN